MRAICTASLIGFRAAVADKALADLAGSDLGQLFRQRHDAFIGEHGGRVLDLIDLCLDFGSDARIAWPTEMVTMPPKKSRYFLPSVSHTYCMLA